MTDAQALFIVDLLGVLCGCYERVARPARWAIRNKDGSIVTSIYEAL